MERFTDALPVRLVDSRAAADPLRLAVAAYLARYTGSSRDHARSDLRCFLSWCAERGLDPLAASRAQLELYTRWMQEVRRFKPSTVSRRFSVTGGFYRTAVIDGVLNHSSAERLSYRDFGRAVRRLALGLSQIELATRAGMTQPALSRLEAGGVIPTIPPLDRISAALDADLIVEIAPHAA